MTNAKVGKKAFKISCLQVKPGYEFFVAKTIIERAAQKEFSPIKIFKGFGTWDLILIYEQDDFDIRLGTLGPIQGILNTTTFLCFQYRETANLDSILDQFSEGIFFGFIFIKLSIPFGENVNQIENRFIDLLNKKISSKWMLFGSLGWNELIVVLSSRDIDSIASELYELNCSIDFDTTAKYFKKTYTQLAVNHEKIDSIASIRANIKACENKLEQEIGNSCIPENLRISIYVASESDHYNNLINYWRNFEKDFVLSACYGENDFRLIVKDKIKWSRFLALLLCFRYIFKNKLCRTNTVFSFTPTFSAEPINIKEFIGDIDESDEGELPFPFKYKELVKSVGAQMAAVLSQHLYRLNSLIQHPLIGDSFSMLSRYPKTIFGAAEKMVKEEQQDKIEHLAQRYALDINCGIELRLYGTFGNIQKSYSQFGSLGGGVQRSLHAMELLPQFIFNSFKHSWKGYIVGRDPKFAHFQEVIWVPTEALWNPKMWWALYHEIAHILIDRAGWVTEEVDSVRKYVEKRREPFSKASTDLLNEIAAEIIGYEFGFFGDYDLYLKLVWEHLINIESKRHDHMDFWTYIVRTFSVELYDKRFYTAKEKEDITDDKFSDPDFIYERFLNHVDSVENIINKTGYVNPEVEKMLKFAPTKAAANASHFMDLLPFFKDIYELNIESKERYNRCFRQNDNELITENTLKAISSIFEGEVFWDRIVSPDAVIYNFLKQVDNDDLSKDIALILSLWNTSIRTEEIK